MGPAEHVFADIVAFGGEGKENAHWLIETITDECRVDSIAYLYQFYPSHLFIPHNRIGLSCNLWLHDKRTLYQTMFFPVRRIAEKDEQWVRNIVFIHAEFLTREWEIWKEDNAEWLAWQDKGELR